MHDNRFATKGAIPMREQDEEEMPGSCDADTADGQPTDRFMQLSEQQASPRVNHHHVTHRKQLGHPQQQPTEQQEQQLLLTDPSQQQTSAQLSQQTSLTQQLEPEQLQLQQQKDFGNGSASIICGRPANKRRTQWFRTGPESMFEPRLQDPIPVANCPEQYFHLEVFCRLHEMGVYLNHHAKKVSMYVVGDNCLFETKCACSAFQPTVMVVIYSLSKPLVVCFQIFGCVLT